MVKMFCDRCRKETTDTPHGAIHGIENADNNGSGTLQSSDCFDVVCDECFVAWRVWMKPQVEQTLEQHATDLVTSIVENFARTASDSDESLQDETSLEKSIAALKQG